MKKKMIVALVIVSIVVSSCSRYTISGPKGSCGAWYPKKCKVGKKGW